MAVPVVGYYNSTSKVLILSLPLARNRMRFYFCFSSLSTRFHANGNSVSQRIVNHADRALAPNGLLGVLCLAKATMFPPIGSETYSKLEVLQM